LNILVALIDWRVDLNVSFGFLYLFPMLMVGICLERWQVAMVAGLCVLLAEWFDPFPWSSPAGIGFGISLHLPISNPNDNYTDDKEEEIEKKS
jgi:hypothetical protein